jgi:hypothetical protein
VVLRFCPAGMGMSFKFIHLLLKAVLCTLKLYTPSDRISTRRLDYVKHRETAAAATAAKKHSFSSSSFFLVVFPRVSSRFLAISSSFLPSFYTALLPAPPPPSPLAAPNTRAAERTTFKLIGP